MRSADTHPEAQRVQVEVWRGKGPIGAMFFAALCFTVACAAGDAEHEGDEARECTDRADNDADGAFDCSDEGCFGSPDCASEDTPEDTAPDGADDTADTPPEETGACAEAGGQIAVTPAEIVLAGLSSGFSSSETLTVSNVGVGRLEIVELAITADATHTFYVERMLGECLGAGEEVTVSVVATLAAPGTAYGELTITNSDPASPEIVVPLHAEVSE